MRSLHSKHNVILNVHEYEALTSWYYTIFNLETKYLSIEWISMHHSLVGNLMPCKRLEIICPIWPSTILIQTFSQFAFKPLLFEYFRSWNCMNRQSTNRYHRRSCATKHMNVNALYVQWSERILCYSIWKSLIEITTSS